MIEAINSGSGEATDRVINQRAGNIEKTRSKNLALSSPSSSFVNLKKKYKHKVEDSNVAKSEA